MGECRRRTGFGPPAAGRDLIAHNLGQPHAKGVGRIPRRGLADCAAMACRLPHRPAGLARILAASRHQAQRRGLGGARVDWPCRLSAAGPHGSAPARPDRPLTRSATLNLDGQNARLHDHWAFYGALVMLRDLPDGAGTDMPADLRRRWRRRGLRAFDADATAQRAKGGSRETPMPSG